MRNITEFINESAQTPVVTTLGKFSRWYLGGHGRFTADELSESDYAFDMREKLFGDGEDAYDKFADYLNKNKDTHISVTSKHMSNGMYDLKVKAGKYSFSLDSENPYNED